MLDRGMSRAQIQAVRKPTMHTPYLWRAGVLLHLSYITNKYLFEVILFLIFSRRMVNIYTKYRSILLNSTRRKVFFCNIVDIYSTMTDYVIP